ncbi:LysR substrate-binding domain-containing protein [Cognatishimia sp. MH4019]|uniref:LysR substrate-binding domain-containing protein n=1 Tax=Cognatishimia sp. MH4019 TaxID=2854030 RepID=UPI002714955E|nr:LysR substrate-binding domain-containing protein [Cognatishimia sp. MH4019]
MARAFYDLPPMTTLVAFEAAARHGSFKTAAAELNVTPGAVSHQIKALEGELGVALFERVHRGVILTEDGQDLFTSVQGAFSAMSRSLSQIKRADTERAITVAATTAVSALWLTPRITAFWRERPDIRVNQVVSDTRVEGSGWDLIIEYGLAKGRAGESRELFTDVLVPVASPEFAANRPVPELAALAAMPLIHLTAQNQDWTTWKRWFAGLGYEGSLARGTKVNNYMIALQAACDGVGVVLGWKRLVAPMLEDGSLVAFGGYALPAPSSFYISRGAKAEARGSVDLLEQWLLK